MSKTIKAQEDQSNDCFIIMPISDYEGYDKGHFKKVYEDILKIACEKAGFNPVRADDVKQTNLIHLDILQKLIKSPMALCDLSTRNPNVLFELGLRQAFDKPTVLVQEIGTPKIFDISPLRFSEYRKELKYREVLEDQNFIAEAIKATKEATDKGEGVNSIVGLLSLSSPASLKDVTDDDSAKMLQIIMAEMNDLRADFRQTIRKDNIVRQTSKEAEDSDMVLLQVNYSRFINLITSSSPIDVVRNAFELLQKQIHALNSFTPSRDNKIKIDSILREADFAYASYIVRK